MRQPHSVTKDESWPQVMNMNVASAEPMSRPVAVEAGTSEQYRPRWLDGAYSARKVAAPAYSPEAENDCTMRRHSSRIGARMPTSLEGGQKADHESGRRHHEDGGGQRPLAALLVAHVPPEEGAHGTHEEGQREHAEGLQQRHASGSPGGMSTSAMTVAK